MEIQSLSFLLAQATLGSAALVVETFEHKGHPNGREAWIELEHVYGAREIDERPAQILTLGGSSRRQGAVVLSTYLIRQVGRHVGGNRVFG